MMRSAPTLLLALWLSACGPHSGRDDEVKITFKFGDQHSLMAAGCDSQFYIVPLGPEVGIQIFPFRANVNMAAGLGANDVMSAGPFSLFVRKGNPRYFAAFGNVYWSSTTLTCEDKTKNDVSYPAVGISEAVDLQGPVEVTIPVTVSGVATKVYAAAGATIPAVTPFAKMKVKWKGGAAPEGFNCTGAHVPLFNGLDIVGLEALTADTAYNVCAAEHEVWPLHPNRKYFLAYKIGGKCKIFERFVAGQKEQVTELDWASGAPCP